VRIARVVFSFSSSVLVAAAAAVVVRFSADDLALVPGASRRVAASRIEPCATLAFVPGFPHSIVCSSPFFPVVVFLCSRLWL